MRVHSQAITARHCKQPGCPGTGIGRTSPAVSRRSDVSVTRMEEEGRGNGWFGEAVSMEKKHIAHVPAGRVDSSGNTLDLRGETRGWEPVPLISLNPHN